jgi:hypothetical protein
MNTIAERRRPFASAPRLNAYNGGIDWEELPSLTRLVVQGPRRDFGDSSAFGSSAWDNTMPASLETLPAPVPFREPIQGLATREISEPDVFRAFFA